MQKFVGQEVLNAFVTVTPLLKDLFSSDILIAVSDTEKILAYRPADTFDIGMKVGDSIKKGSSIETALNSKQREEVMVSKEVYGIPYRAISQPIFDEEDNIIGGIGIAVSIDNQNRLQEIIDQFSSAFQQVNSSVQEIATGAQNLSKTSEELSTISFRTKEDISKTDDIISIIRNIADQTKMLGLNAAIEAARAGEYGRGFSVVAEEIRRLSEESNTSAKKVTEILAQIAKAIDDINNDSQETSSVSQQQAAATQEIAASIQELTAQLESLNEFVKLV